MKSAYNTSAGMVSCLGMLQQRGNGKDVPVRSCVPSLNQSTSALLSSQLAQRKYLLGFFGRLECVDMTSDFRTVVHRLVSGLNMSVT